ncbi:MAG: LacI family transcriptional regulator [Anaerolineae bacterium]|nr:LacI family transcriptional regulator [Anaerolineae bacterium]
MSKRQSVTIRDVAQKAGVGLNTVSLTLKDSDLVRSETKSKVKAAIEELGYVPNVSARNLRRGTVRTIGVMIPDIHNFHYWDIVAGVEDEARHHDYGIVLSNTNLNPQLELDSLRGLLERRYDGLILMATHTHSKETPTEVRKLLDQGSAIVTIGSTWREVDKIEPYPLEAGPLLMQHLYNLGHRRIGFVLGVAHQDLASGRLEAYCEFTARHNLPQRIEYCGPTIPDGMAATHRLLDDPARPTAIVTVNDYLAVAAMRTIALRGLCIPADISLAGFDNIPLSQYLTPALTTVDVGGPNRGREAVRLLLERLKDPKRPTQIVKIPASLHVRESTGPPPAAFDSRMQPEVPDPKNCNSF